MLTERAKDGQPDVCWSRASDPSRSVCSRYYERHETVIGLGEMSHFAPTGRYVGETLSGVPHGNGLFTVTDLSAPVFYLFSFVKDPAEPDLDSQLQAGRALVLDGQWTNGAFTGAGRVIMPQGGTLEGNFQNAILVKGEARSITRRAIGLMFSWAGGRYTGSIIDGRIANGKITSRTTDRENRDWTLVEEGSFEEEHVVTGDRTLMEGSVVVWIETCRRGECSQTYRRR